MAAFHAYCPNRRQGTGVGEWMVERTFSEESSIRRRDEVVLHTWRVRLWGDGRGR